VPADEVRSAASRGAPGMKDVARLAGVSHQTVSRVLNDSPNVRPDTRTRVLAAMRTLGYRPNHAARALVTGRSRVLGVATLGGRLFGPAATLYSVQQAAHVAGYGVSVVAVPDASVADLAAAVSLLIRQGVDGVVLIAPVRITRDLPAEFFEELPLVALQAAAGGRPEVIGVDQVAGARLATRHLLDLGHRTVWHVTGPGDWFDAADRVVGWRATLEAAGAEVPPPLAGDWSARSGYRAGRVLARIPELTAVFAANDSTAFGVLRALAERGRRVPEEVSVVGYDDVPEAGFLTPPLTTVRQDFAEVGRRGVARLIELIEPPDPARTLGPAALIEPTLAVRRSSGPPPE
jgi:DNA-binding LacI/PurR family transcriptional regulator